MDGRLHRRRGPPGALPHPDTVDNMGPGDRVLLTSLPGTRLLKQLAAHAAGGAIVVLAPRDALPAARRECAHLDHVLFVEGSRDEIPWAEAWFDAVLDPRPDEPTPEILRVLRPGGSILSPAAALTRRDDASPHSG